MYEFKKTDSKELERTITITLAMVIILTHLVNFLQQLKVLDLGRIEGGSIVLPLGALILLFFDIMYFIKSEEKKFKPVYIFVILTIISLILSFVFAKDKDFAISGADLHAEGIFVFLSYLVIFVSATLITDDKNRKNLYFLMTALGVFEVVLGVLQAQVQPEFLKATLEEAYFDTQRAYGTLENPNPYGSVMAVYLAMETVLCIGFEKKNRLIHALLVGVYAYGLFLSGTRGAIVGYVFAMLMLATLFAIRIFAKKEKPTKKTAFGILVTVIAVLAAFVIFYVSAKSSFEDISSRVAADVNTQNAEQLGTSRIQLWKETIKIYKESNLFLGIGISNLVEYVNLGDYWLLNYDAHNRYLQILVTMGLVGLTVYISFILYVFWIGIKRVIKVEAKGRLGIICLLACYITYMVADFFCIGVYSLAPYIYIVMGLIVSHVVYETTNVEIKEQS